MNSENKILLFGGTFNPIHYGHLIMAQEALERLSFNEVIFIPSATPPHKKDVLSFFHRLKMTQLATEGISYFKVSDIEGQRDGPSYTIDTIRHFKKNNKDSMIYWLIGTDMVSELKTWYKIKELIQECKFVIAERNPYNLYTGKDKNLFDFIAKETKDFLKNNISDNFIPIVNSVLEISSTDIRTRIINNKKYAINFLTPKKIGQYIYDNNLYKNKCPNEDL